MCRYRLRLTRPLEHEQLRENGDRFQPYREGPKDLGHLYQIQLR